MQSDTRIAAPSPPEGHVLRTSCDRCRQLKIRCDRQGDSCVRCIMRGKKCTTTFLPRRQPKLNRRDKIDEMEIRIKRMESLLATVDFNSAIADRQNSASLETGDELSTLRTDDANFSLFIGSFSGLSLFSPIGLKWISETTGTTNIESFISDWINSEIPSHARMPGIWHPFSPKEGASLPPKQTADHYINCFFESFNRTAPIFDRETFTALCERQYSSTPPTDPAWYASFNIVLAIGSLSSERNGEWPNPKKSEDAHLGQHNGWRYLRNSCSVFTDLLFSNRSTMAIQALLAMAMMFDLLFDGEAASTLGAAAARLAISLGLHRKLKHVNLSASETSQRQNVFWALYVFENMINHRMGRPSTIDDNDIEIEPPSDNGTFGDLTFFSNRVKLSIIENKIYTQLYSCRSRQKPGFQRLNLINGLHKSLSDWRDALPEIIQPEKPILCATDHVSQAVMLSFAYFNSIITLHRLSIYNALQGCSSSLIVTSLPCDVDIPHQAYSSHLICLDASRNSARLLLALDPDSNLPRDNIIRHILYYPMSAFLVLFVNILQNPLDSYVSTDIGLLSLITDYLCPAPSSSHSSIRSLALGIFKRLKDIAESYVAEIQSFRPLQMKRTCFDTDQSLDKYPRQKTGFAASDHTRNSAPRSPSEAETSAFPETQSAASNDASPPLPQGNDSFSENPLLNPFLPWTIDWEWSHLWSSEPRDYDFLTDTGAPGEPSES